VLEVLPELLLELLLELLALPEDWLLLLPLLPLPLLPPWPLLPPSRAIAVDATKASVSAATNVTEVFLMFNMRFLLKVKRP
jgi:hypothetical protein